MSSMQALPRDAMRVWVASHLTILFSPVSARSSRNIQHWRDTLTVGSIGLGFSIDAGVITEVSRISGNVDQHQVWFDDQLVPSAHALVSYRAIKLLEEEVGKLPPTRVRHHFEVPIGGGFGTSAAGVLGLLTGLRNLHELEFSDLELFQLAHAAEVLERGGLGDILGLHYGGFEHRVTPGGPGLGMCRRYTKLEKQCMVLVKFFSQLETKNVLGNPTIMKSIKTVGHRILTSLGTQATPDLEFLKNAIRDFDLAAGMMNDQVFKELSRLWAKDYLAGQVMIGNAVFVLLDQTEKEFGRKIRQLEREGYNSYKIVDKTVKAVDGAESNGRKI